MRNTTSREARTGILIFLTCTFAISLMFYVLTLRAGVFGATGGLYALGLMWCPALGALIACHVRHRPLASMGWSWNSDYQGIAYGLPGVHCTTAYAVVWLFGVAGFPNAPFVGRAASDLGLGDLPTGVIVSVYVVLNLTLGVIRALPGAFGQELGWRGYLVPELYKVTSFTATALISALVSLIWSLPVVLLVNYETHPISPYGLACYTVTTIGLGFVLAWVRLRSGSLWPAVTLHATHMVLVQAILTPLTDPWGRSPYFIGEFGAALAIAMTAVGAVVWSRRRSLDRPRIDARHAFSPRFYDLIVRSTGPLRGP